MNNDNSLTYLVLFCLGIIVLVGGIVWFGCEMEARAYNRVTGRQVTAWDALWLELRVTP